MTAPTPPKPHRDSIRETVETVVFVVVLVLMLKLFVVEAFVIPTGSMAETLFGYKKVITCPECGHVFEVNASREAEPPAGAPRSITVGYCCPNCRYQNSNAAAAVEWTSGDRVLVGKFMGPDERGRVVVFKYPDAPQTGQVAQNYIKRLVGFGGETIAVYNGDLYVTDALKYPATDADGRQIRPVPEREIDRWRARGNRGWNGPDYGYPHDPDAVKLFDDSMASGFTLPGGFRIVRKPDDLVMAMRRIVYDNDHQAKGLVAAKAPPRWGAGSEGNGWAADNPQEPKAFAHTGGSIGWIRYRHLLPKDADDPPSPVSDPHFPRTGWSAGTADLEPRLITNFLGYNGGFEAEVSKANGIGQPVQGNLAGSYQWCGDLMLECKVKVDDPAAKFVLELSKGANRYQAEFEGGRVKLIRTGPGGGELAAKETPITKAGQYAVRFANVDCRLRVWVDDRAIDFGDAADYPPPVIPSGQPGWTPENDLKEPAGIGASGGVEVSGLKLWRDTHYTHSRANDPRNAGAPRSDLDTYYVQPGHYLCMGDNSAQSSDGRTWGLVPERLMLGRAVFVFFPLNRVGFIK